MPYRHHLCRRALAGLFVLTGLAVGGRAQSGTLALPGDTSFARVANVAGLSFAGSAPFTLEAWVRPDRFTSRMGVLSNFSFGEGGEFIVMVEGGRPRFLREAAPRYTAPGVALASGTWYHLAAVFDGSRKRLYVNGALVVEDAVASGGIGSFSGWLLGAWGVYGRPSHFFTGAFDEVRVWRTARSSADLAAAMRRPLTGTESGLAAYWTFDAVENLGAGAPGANDVRDRTGNGHTLDLAGRAAVAPGGAPLDGRPFPQPLRPEPGAKGVPAAPVLVWSPAVGADSVAVEVADDTTFRSGLTRRVVRGTTAAFSGLAAGDHVWRVAAFTRDTLRAWSRPYAFSVGDAPPGAVMGLGPPDGGLGAVTDSLRWNAAAGATAYELQLHSSLDLSSPFLVAYLNGLSYEYDFVPNGYGWRVRAVNDAGAGPWTAIRRLEVVRTTVPEPAAPNYGARVSPDSVRFTWQGVPGALRYNVQVARTVGFTAPLADLTTPDGAAVLVVPHLPIEGVLYWRVRAITPAGPGTWSAVASFATTLVAPGLTSPADGATNLALSVPLVWTTPAGNATYEVHLSSRLDFSTLVVTRFANGASTTVAGLAPSTVYYWRVRAVGGSGARSAWSPAWAFVTGVGPLAAPTLTAPVAGAAGVPIDGRFTWEAVPAATSYTLEVARDAAFTQGVLRMTGVTTPSTQVPGLVVNTDYYWHVRIERDAASGPWSDTRPFRTGTLTGVDDADGVPERFGLDVHGALPARGAVRLRLGLPEAGPVTVEAFGPDGRRVVVVAEGTFPAGYHALTFDAAGLPVGLYLVRATAAGRAVTRAVVVVR